MRTNILQLLFTLSFTGLINTVGVAQDLPKSTKPIKTTERDSLFLSTDSLRSQSLNLKENDSIISDSIPKKKELLEDVVKYKAKDYASINQRDQKIYLYNEAEVYYQDMEITAGIIVIDYSKNLVYAGRLKDSLGNYEQAPVFKQAENVVEPDSIIFNFKNKKALIFNSRTEQSGGYIDAELTKKENDSVYFLKEGRYTTSENREDPEYYFRMRKAKLVPGKKVVVGLTNLYIYNVPTPIGLPFAYFPMSQKQTSGILLPSFGQENNRGYFLQNGGYYFAISDFVDLAVTGDYYTNGSYGLRMDSQYALRYRFRGNIGFRYENLINSERGFPDYAKSSIYNIRWSHSQDSKSNPSSRFSASVNLGSSRYYQQSINQINQSNFLNNTLSSSVSYSKTFDTEPQINYSVTATHSQNTQTQRIDLT
ncbi:MAG: putative LPS assembly protein LptD, partial [Aquaticitalea sp.]